MSEADRGAHPAIPLIRAGKIPEALAYLRARGDHPSGLALLKAHFIEEAVEVLLKVPPSEPRTAYDANEAQSK